MKKVILKILPYVASILAGFLFYFLEAVFKENIGGLFVNISAAFFAIPFIFLFYQLVNNFAHKKLNKEIFDYAKMQVDRELLSILNQLQKIVFTLEEKKFSSKAVNKFLSYKKDDLESKLQVNRYLGFQVFKHWEISEKGLHDLLKNPFVLEKMEDEQIISVIGVLKSLRELELIQRIDGLYIETNEIAKGYKIQSGIEMNPENKKFPDRYMLLKHSAEDKFVVYDFGDIPKYNLDKCLRYYKVNKKVVKSYAEVIFNLLKDINSWLDATGLEFIIDTKMFKMTGKHIT